MHDRKNPSPLNSLGDVLTSLSHGEQLVLCTPTCEYGNQLLVPLSSSFPHGSKTLLISTQAVDHHLLPTNVSKLLDLSAARSRSGAIALLRKELKRLPKSGTVYIASVVHEERQGAYFELLARLTRKIPQRLVWLVSHDSLTAEKISALKEKADFFAEVTHIGTNACVQFLTAKNVYSTALFLPRVLSFDNSGIVLSRPILPMPSAASPQPADQPSAVYTVGDLLDQKYHRAFDSAHGAILIFKLGERFLEANKSACDLIGYSIDELRDARLSDLVPARCRQSLLRSLVTLQRKGRAVLETQIQRKSGRLVDIHFLVSRMGQDLYVGIAHDITELNRSDAILSQREEDFRNLVEQDSIARAIYVNNRPVLNNREFVKTFSQISGEGASHLTLQRLFGKKNRDLAKEINALAEATDPHIGPLAREASFITSAGDTVSFDVSASLVMFGKRQGVQCSFVDVTPRARIVRSLQDSESKFRVLVESSQEAISIEQDEKFTFVNKAFLELFGYRSLDDVVGKESSVTNIKTARARKTHAKKDEQAAPDEVLGQIRRNDGTTADVRIRRLSSVIDGLPASVAFYRDISAEKQTEDATRRHAQALERARTVSLNIFRTLELDELFRLTLAACMTAVDFELGAIFRLGQDNVTLEMALNEGLSEKLAKTLGQLSVDEGLAGYAAKTREPLFLSVKDYPPYLPHRSLFASENVHTLAVLPLCPGTTVTGMIIVASRRVKSWTEEDKLLLTSLRPEIDAALANTLRYEQLKRSEELYRSMVEGVTDVLYKCAPNGSFLFLSSAIRVFSGHDPQEFYRVKSLWRDLIHPDDRPTYSQRISNQTQNLDELRIEYRFLPKGKASYHWVRDSLKYTRDADGQVISISGTLSDITDQREAERSAAKSEGLKGDILNSIQEGVVVLDSQFQYLDWNKSMERITGISRDSIVGRSFEQGMSDRAKPELRLLLNRALGGQAMSSEDMPFPVAGVDQERFFWSHYAPLRDPSGTINGVVGIVTDVTSSRQLEREVRESEETLRNVIDTMGDALTICDLQGRVWEANSEFSRLTGYPRREVLGMDFPYPWVLEEDMAKYVEWVAALREKKYLRDLDMTWKAKDGRSVAISMSTTLLRNALGEPVAMLNISRDISERKQLVLALEHKVKENVQLYAEVQAQVHRITSLYELGKSLTGTLDRLTLLDIVHAEVAKAIPLDRFSYYAYVADQQCLNQIYDIAKGQRSYDKQGIESKQIALTHDSVFWEVITKGRPFAGPSPGKRTRGMSLLAIPVKSKETVVGLIAVVKAEPDVYTETHLRLLESIANLSEIAMEKAMLYEDTVNKAREIETRNKELDEFTYVVSHDLKEPLISIEGFSKILLKDYQNIVDQEGKEYLATVVQATTHMKYLIDDLLTLSRVGHVKESVELVSCGDVIMEILHDIQFTLRAKNVAVNVEPSMPQVRYNRTQLGMVFRNLISNAMKFNDKPQPTIDISIRDEGGQYVLLVRDNGIGIDERYYDRIFMIFQRLQRKEDYEGTGAGLTIVKKIVENHHGRIWVDSVVGEGTTFSFTIPK